jgi:hypothetical protein
MCSEELPVYFIFYDKEPKNNVVVDRLLLIVRRTDPFSPSVL